MFAEIIDEFIEVEGHVLRYWQTGPQDGEVVLLLHGIGAASDVWGFLAADLAEAQYHVIALDLPGFGKSVSREPIPVPDGYISLLDRFLEKLGLSNVIVIGHSMGGIMAAGLAERCPEKVTKLVLISSGGFGKIFSPYRVFGSSLSERFLLPLVGSRLIGSCVFRFFYGFRLPGKVIRELASHWRDYDLSNNFSRVMREFGDWKVIDQLPNIKSPVLIIWGTWDFIVPVSHSEVACKLLPQAKIIRIKTKTHCLHTGSPGKVNPIIVDFLEP